MSQTPPSAPVTTAVTPPVAGPLSPDAVAALFTRPDGRFGCARWGRPLAPVVFGVEDDTVAVIRGALQAVAGLARRELVETDPELGANLMMFFCRDWDELPAVPDLDRLVPDLGPLVGRLSAAGANQYRLFRFDDDGAIRAAFVFLRMDDVLSGMAADALALDQAVRVILTWAEGAFADASPLALTGGGGDGGGDTPGGLILRPEIAAVIRAAYDPVLPPAATDPSHALRLSARIDAAGAR